MLNPSSARIKDDNETVVLHIIDQIIQKGNNNDLINKITSIITLQAQTNRQIREVAEFQSLLYCS